MRCRGDIRCAIPVRGGTGRLRCWSRCINGRDRGVPSTACPPGPALRHPFPRRAEEQRLALMRAIGLDVGP